MGEPAGVASEITLRAWTRREELSLPPFIAVDDPDRLAAVAADLGLSVAIECLDDPLQAAAVFSGALPVYPVALAAPVIPGRPNPANGAAVLASIKTAVKFAMEGRARAVVTNPVHKGTLYEAGFPHPGHTEFLGALTGTGKPVMMLVCPGLRVVPVTVHVPLASVAEALTVNGIVRTAEIVHAALRSEFGIAEPRLAVAALNPHAGEGGKMGAEEVEIIAPAIDQLRKRGFAVSGPEPADALFRTSARAEYDAAIAMYHDQALIPVKTLDFDHAVNVTLGLPIIRTSPDHGSALGLAGKGSASEASLLAALAMADLMVRRRAIKTPGTGAMAAHAR